MTETEIKEARKDNIRLVITTYSFDREITIKAFKTDEEAERFLEEDLNEEIRILVEENEFPEEEMEVKKDDDGWYAQLIEHRCDLNGWYDDVMTWTIVEMKREELIPGYSGKG